ncbi:MAG: hypothetical protein MI861_22260, partial [Pirellulales bacterium]|nr:hypothetical protein [Pirellulales bacterium]
MRQLFSLALCCLVGAVARCEDWPQWRGPRGDGTSAEVNVPIRWDGVSGENIAWKTGLSGIGH